MDENQEIVEARYVRPDMLPGPKPSDPSPPIVTVALGAAIAVGMGVALFAASRVFYVYILYNWAIGAAIGWGMGVGVKQSRFTQPAVLFVLAAGFSLLSYLTYNLVWWISVQGDPSLAGIGLFEFMAARAEFDTFIGGAEIGTVGNLIVWAVELGISVYFAWQRIHVSAQMVEMEAVPPEVVQFVLSLLAEGETESGVRQELATRGWTRVEDQDRAFNTSRLIVAAAQEQAAG